MSDRILTPADIPDTILYEALLKKLNCSPNQLSAGMTSKIEIFEVCGLNKDEIPFRSLRGIEWLKNLKELKISFCNAKDLSPLSKLEHLKKLSIGTQTESLNPLHDLVELQELELSDCNVDDVSPLCGLINLESLTFCNGNFGNLSCLKNLPNIRKFSVEFANVRLGSFLCRLRKLTSLSLDFNGEHIPDVDLHWISNMKCLQFLSIGTDYLKTDYFPNLKIFSSLESLCELYISARNIGDLGPLSTLKNLTVLGLQTSKHLQNTAAISKLKSLKTLRIEAPCLNLIAFSNLKSLKNMEISSKTLYGFSELSNLKNLQTLRLTACFRYISPRSALCSLSDLSPIWKLKKLHTLNIDCERVKDISGISNLIKISSLSIHAPLQNIQPLSNLVSLKHLYLSGCHLKSLDPLKNLQHLRNLSFNNCEIDDISPLIHLHKLKNLNFWDTAVKDLRPLLTLHAKIDYRMPDHHNGI